MTLTDIVNKHLKANEKLCACGCGSRVVVYSSHKNKTFASKACQKRAKAREKRATESLPREVTPETHPSTNRVGPCLRCGDPVTGWLCVPCYRKNKNVSDDAVKYQSGPARMNGTVYVTAKI